MKVLALTSSTSSASLALGDDHQIFERAHGLPRGHVEFMNQALADLLQESGWSFQDLDLIALDQGPGSFTGLRVSVSLARSLCYLLTKPCFLTQSIDLLAMRSPTEPCLVGINAYKNLIFSSFVQSPLTRTPTKALSIPDFEEQFFAWKAHLPSCPSTLNFYGDGWKAYESLWSTKIKPFINHPSPPVTDPRARDLVRLALNSAPKSWTEDWKEILPLYLRASAAEESLRKP